MKCLFIIYSIESPNATLKIDAYHTPVMGAHPQNHKQIIPFSSLYYAIKIYEQTLCNKI